MKKWCRKNKTALEQHGPEKRGTFMCLPLNQEQQMSVDSNRIQKLTEAKRVHALEGLLAEMKVLEKSIYSLIPTP